MLKKIVTSLLIAATVISLNPIGAKAAWKQNNTGWWYSEENGYSNGWKQIDGFWYYFDSDGYMKTGWLQDNGKWYYLISSGVMKTGWVQDGSTWYYLDDTGKMITGKVSVEGTVYEFQSNGKWIDTTSANTNSTSCTYISKKPSKEKLKSTSDFSWFEENGNTYFKTSDYDYSKNVIDNEPYPTGPWNIDDALYFFDKNGVLQKGEFTTDDGFKYLLGDDGKCIKCLSDEHKTYYASYGLTTKSTTNNRIVEFDDEFEMPRINESDSYFNNKAKPTVGNRTLYCKTGQTIRLSDFLVYTTGYRTQTTMYDEFNTGVAQSGTDVIGLDLLPNLTIKSESSDKDIAFSGIYLYKCDGAMRGIIPYVIARKPGKVTITLDVNRTKTSLDVIVTE